MRLIFLSIFFSFGALALEQQIQEELRKAEAQGAAVAVVSKDKIEWMAGIGVADLENGRPVTIDTVFAVASVSKVILGVALNKLREDGLLDFNKPLKSVLPDVSIDNPFHSPVLIRHVLEHTSGFQEVIAPWYDESLPKYISAKELVTKILREQTVRWQPGDVVTYSNYNYMLAAYLIEHASGLRLDDYLKKVFYIPLGMTHSSFRLERIPPNKLAKGYLAPGKALPHLEGHYRYAAGLNSSVADLAKFMQMLLSNGSFQNQPIIKSSSLDYMETPTSSLAARAGLTLGHGPGIVTRQTGGRIFSGHNGAADGFTARFYYSRKHGYGYIILLNAHLLPKIPSRSRIARKILEEFFPTPNEQPAISVTNTNLESFSGFYRFENPRFELTSVATSILNSLFVSVDGDHLLVRKLFSKPEIFLATGEKTFRRPHELRTSLVFGDQYLHQGINKFYLKSSSIPTMIFLSCSTLCFFFLLSNFFIFPFYLIQKSRKKIFAQQKFYLLNLVTASCFALIFILALPIETSKAATSFNPNTFGIFAASLIFPHLCLFGLIYGSFTLAKQRTPSFYFFFLVASAHATIALGMYSHNLTGIQLWNLH